MAAGVRILGLHIRDSLNAGDRYSCPLEYFAFPGHEIILGDMRAPPSCAPDVVVYGGGSITASPAFRRWPGAITIAWGVGHHVRSEPWDDAMHAEHGRAAYLCDLYFPRDAVRGFQVVPDASCLHPVFDEIIEPRHAVVCYSAARRIDVSNGSDPHMTNEDGSVEDAVRFLGSGRKIVTSSYHGVYWAWLLGRSVKMVAWGSKFFYLPSLNLSQCREANRSAYARVVELLDG